MGRFWRASTVGGVRLPIAPGCKHPASVMPRHHRVPAPHLSSREARRGAPSCRASMHQHKGCAQRRPPQDGTAGCQCTSTKAEHNDNHHSRGMPRTCPPLKAGKVHHHAGRQCTSTKAVHKDDHHKMGPQGVNAPARRLSTMTSPAVGARWGRPPTSEAGLRPASCFLP